MTANT